MKANPDYTKSLRRLKAYGKSGHPFSGTVFRFISPKFSRPKDIVSGEGGLNASGRWNLKGSYRICYTSTDPETALAESLAHARYFNLPLASSLPRTLVSIDVRLRNVLDLTDGKLRQRLKLGITTLKTHDWRRVNQELRESTTQSWGRSFFETGYEAVLVPSTATSGRNLIVFPSNLNRNSKFEVVP